MADLDVKKTYVWFLKDKVITKGPGYPKLALTWRGVDVDHEIHEYHSLTGGVPGQRIQELMGRLGWTPNGKDMMDEVSSFMKLGIHLWAEVQRHWTISKDDAPEYEFTYETIKGNPPVTRQADKPLREKIQKYIRGLTTYTEMSRKIRDINPSYLPELEAMKEDGELPIQ
jgi:hypothetical protein